MSLSITQSTESSAPLVVLTAPALEKTREFMAATEGGCLRVGVRGGGCSGFQYQLAVDHPQPDDLVWEQEDITLICDPASLAYLKGTTLDYKETFEEAGFVYENPNATTACGCGSSFRVDDQGSCGDPSNFDAGEIYGQESAL